MNIMIITQALTGGGAEKLAANLSLQLSKDNRVIFVTYTKSRNEYDYRGERINKDLPGGKGGLLKHVNVALDRIKKVREIKKQYKIDCAISFLPQMDYVNVLTKRKNEKVLIDVVSNMSFVYPSGIKHLFRRWIINNADHVVTVSEGVRQDLLDNFGVKPKKCTTIYNSCDLSAIRDDCLKNSEFQRLKGVIPNKYICSMGSFRHPKGHWHLIKAFSYIKDQVPDIDLVILGDGVYREQYTKIIELLGVKDRVIVPGFANPPYSVIAHSDLFVFSSVFEGFGHSVIEAMACGVPVLSTDCDYGPREIIAPGTPLNKKAVAFEEHEYGYLLPPFDMKDIEVSSDISNAEKMMGEAILRVLNSKEKNEMIIEKCSSYVKKFDNEEYGRQWLEVMKGI